MGEQVSFIRATRVAGEGREFLPMADVNEPVDVVIADGQIADIAPTGNLRATGRIVEAEGTWLVPGLWDHHVHAVQWALSSQREPLGAALSAVDAAHRMSRVAPLADGRRVGMGFRDALWPDAPTRALLDDHTGDVPTYLINADVHSVWLNSAALRREGLEGADDDGVLREAAAFEISRRLNATDDVTADNAVAAAGEHAASRGVVGIVDFDMGWNADAWARRLRNGFDAHRVDFAVYPDQLDRALRDGLRSGDALDVEGLPAEVRDLVRMGSLKVISDGSLGTRTAACSHAYTDDLHNQGVLTVGPDELHDLLVRAAGGGISAAVHAIGDVAVTAALDAFAAADTHGTIEHAQLVRHSDLARFARLDIEASVQPQHALDDHTMAERLWAGQTSLAYPLASLHRAGAGLRLGSDAPVSVLDPWHAIAAAVTRELPDGSTWMPEERIDIDTALRASSWGGTLGTTRIAPGSVADLALCGIDPRTADAAALRSMPIMATMVAGRLTHGG